MRKHLFVTLLLMCGLPLTGAYTVMAEPAPQSQSQQTVSITGTVLDENNEPVIGASVVQKGVSKNAAATDAFGHFTLRVPAGSQLVVSYVGYKTTTLAAANDMTVYLQPTTEMLNELVAVGYGSQKRANLTGAVATVDVARVMDSRPATDVVKALQGAVPGMTITSGDGSLMGSATIKIRGTGTLSNDQTSNPLIVVDGVPVDDLSMVNPEDIADISVLKDASSSAVYGTRAAFGVILITTKNPSKADRVSVKYNNNFGWSQATVLPDFPTVPEQLQAQVYAAKRDKTAQIEVFGMYPEQMLPIAKLWQEQNGGKIRENREMRPYVDDNNVGDYMWNGQQYIYYADWDVAGILYNNASPSQKHNVSLEGTSGKTQYRAAFGFDGSQDLMNYAPDKRRRYTANVNLSTEIFSWLRAGVRFNFGQRNYYSHYVQTASRYTHIWRWGSYFNVLGWRYDDNGEKVQYRTIASREGAGERNFYTTDTKIQAWFEADILKGLTLHGDFAYDVMANNQDRTMLPVVGWNTWSNASRQPSSILTQANSEAYQFNTRSNSWNYNVYLTYANKFGLNNLKVMLGTSADSFYSNYFMAGVDVLMDNSLPYLGLTTGGADGTQKYIENTITKRASAGFFGRINYDYNGIYLLEVNGRYDGSSSFPAHDQWAFFPSASAGYRFSEEPYFASVKDTGILTNGKVRASYGHIGNDAIGPYKFISTIGTKSSYWLNSAGTAVNMLTMPALVSSTLSWERVITTDVGLDLGFLNNSLNVTFDWFQRDTKDMLAPGNDLPAVLGASSPLVNEGHLRTRGWELGLSWNHSFGDWDVYATANLYDGITKVVNYNTEVNSIGGFYTGQTYGEIWGFETDRYFTEDDFVNGDYAPGVPSQKALEQGNFVYGPGDIKFKDLDGNNEINGGLDASDPNCPKDADGNPYAKGTAENHGDLKVIGNATPRYEYSFRLGGAWKGFDIDLYFQGVGKRHMWSTSGFVIPMANNYDVLYANQTSYNYVDDSGKYFIDQNNDYPVMMTSNAGGGAVSGLLLGNHNFYPQSKYLMNMAYLRFKTLTIGYTLPAQITKKALIQKARLYFSADNLALLYNGMKKYPIDPETGSQWAQGVRRNNPDGMGAAADNALTNSQVNGYFGRTAPINRTFSFGIQVTF